MAREQEKEQVVDKEGEDKGNRRQSILQAVRSSMSNVTMQDEDTGEDVCDTTLAVLSIAFISVLGHAETQSARTSFRSTWSVGLHWTTHQTTGTVAVCAVYVAVLHYDVLWCMYHTDCGAQIITEHRQHHWLL